MREHREIKNHFLGNHHTLKMEDNTFYETPMKGFHPSYLWASLQRIKLYKEPENQVMPPKWAQRFLPSYPKGKISTIYSRERSSEFDIKSDPITMSEESSIPPPK